jgi:hypothetical protein
MGKFPTLAIANSRDLAYVLASIVASACIALALTLAWPNSARSTGSQELKVDFDAVFASVSVARIQDAPTGATNVDFDQVFASMTEPSPRANTPQNREKLRNAGWRRIL